MAKVEKNVAVVLSTEDIKAMIQTKTILNMMANVIEDSGVELTEQDEAMLMELSDSADTIDQIFHALKGNKFEWTLYEEMPTMDENGGFSWY